MTVENWFGQDEENVVILFNDVRYLIKITKVSLITEKYYECRENQLLNTEYYNLLDIGLPEVACESEQITDLIVYANMEETVNRCFVINETRKIKIVSIDGSSADCQSAEEIPFGTVSVTRLKFSAEGGRKKRKPRN